MVKHIATAAAWEKQKFFYNVTKAGEVKYGNLVQIERNGNGVVSEPPA